MKKTAASIALLLLLFAAPASAATRYVTDLLEITVRSGPGLQYRVIKTLRSGKTVDVLETEEGWSKISLGEDNTGWVLSRYLRATQPDSVQVESLKAQIGPLRKQIETLESENDRLIRMNQEMADELEKTQKKLQETATAYETLKTESQDYLKLKAASEKLRKEVAQKNQRITDLEKKLTDAFLSAAIKWFLAGAGVLILGMLLGSRSKRKRPGLR